MLVSLSLFLAQKYISRERVKQEILALLSSRVGWEFGFDSVDFQFLLKPRLTLRNGSFSIPGKIDGTFDTLVVYPKVLPLLTGKVDVSSLELVSPIIKISLPELPGGAPETEEKPDTIGLLRSDIASALKYLDSHDKGLRSVIKNGSAVLSRPGREDLSVTGLNVTADLPDENLKLRVSGRSNLWDSLIFNIRMDVKSLDGSGNLSIEGLKPHILSRYFSNSEGLIEDSSVDALLNYTTVGLEQVEASLEAQIPKLTLANDGEKFVVKVKELDADLYFGKDKSAITLNRADIISPGLSVRGQYTADRASGTVGLSLAGSDVNVDSARDVTLLAAGENDVVGTIFDVVRGGTVPEVTLDAKGVSFRDLWKKGNFTIKGNMINGNIYIPVAEFDITDASGDAIISDEKLEGRNLNGKLGNSSGSGGTLLLGLKGPDGPFSLDIAVDADPAEIPPVISQFVQDSAVRKELGLLSNVKGKVSGRLRLGDKKNSAKPVIDASGFDITADYGRFPYPLHIEGGDFRFADNVMQIKGLDVTGGNSSLSSVSGKLGLGNKDMLDLKTGSAVLDIGEIFLWLKTLDGLGPRLARVGFLSGTAEFPSTAITGPVSDLKLWAITAQGRLSGVNLTLPVSGEKLTIANADVNSSGGRLTVSNAVLSVPGSSVNLDMVLSDYFTDLIAFKMNFGGTLDPRAMHVLSGYVPMPEELAFPGPLTVEESTLELRAGPRAGGASPVWNLDVNVSTDALEWNDAASETPPAAAPPPAAAKKWDSPVSGNVNVRSESFKFKDFSWSSVDAVVSFFEHGIDIDVEQADLCGISTPGLVNVSAPGIRFEFKPSTYDEELEGVLKCLLDKAGIITGNLDLNAAVTSSGMDGGFVKALQGGVELTSTDGWVEKYGGLARFFAVLNFGDLFRGQGPDFAKEGFHYDKLTAKADISDGKVELEEAVMEGPSLKVIGSGVIDLINKKLDLEIVVIPIMAVDSVIEKIPLINFVLGSDAVSIPIRVTGDISDPAVSQISPSALRFGILGLIKQTLNIPATIIKPMNNGEGPAEDSGQPAPRMPVSTPAGAMPGLENK